MTGISHKLAQRYLRAAADGLIRDNQRVILNAHLRDCVSCRAEADELNALEARLQKNFQARWDASDGPSRNVMTTIQSRSRRIIMTNRINTGLKTAAGLAALLVLIVFLNSAVGKLRNSSVLAGATESIGTAQSIQSSGLIAFVSIQDRGNYEIFTMKADGSELKNLTNNLATDRSPSWSPDGTRIAFTSDRSGDTDIYVMNADGSSLSRLTDDRGHEDNFSWSPDGQRIVYNASENSHNQNGRLMVMDADGGNKMPLTKETGSYIFLNWSPDGKKIVFQNLLGDFADGFQMQSVNIDDINSDKGIFFLGEGKDSTYQIHWETSEHIVAISANYKEKQPTWKLTRFLTSDVSLPDYYVSGSTLVLSNSPIVAIFDKTYVVESKEDLIWFAYEGAPIPLSPWRFSEVCETLGDSYLHPHFISPDRKHSIVSVYCGDGTTSFLLMNEDGTEIYQLGVSFAKPSQAGDISWSPDGRYVIVAIAGRQDQELYLFDIEKMLNDPSMQPIQLTTDGASKHGVTWQPQP